ncbi:MAG: hypothetical protein IKY61_01965, partial [Thermoguttaceae bacterium]|nr:hypothetical protein [Thermoguttaceae bacterium]
KKEKKVCEESGDGRSTTVGLAVEALERKNEKKRRRRKRVKRSTAQEGTSRRPRWIANRNAEPRRPKRNEERGSCGKRALLIPSPAIDFND